MPTSPLQALFAILSRAFKQVFGEWHWQPPVWLAWIARRIALAARFLVADIKRAIALPVLLAAIFWGWVWYKNRPVPHYVTVTVAAPGLTEYGDKGISSIQPLAIRFDESAAPLE